MADQKRIGRPPALTANDATLKQLKGLGNIRCTRKEAAAALGVSEPTIIKFLQDNPEALEAFEEGEGLANVSLRRQQFRAAEKGNAAVLIFLGKNYLGQSDRREITGLDGGPVRMVREVRRTIIDPARDGDQGGA